MKLSLFTFLSTSSLLILITKFAPFPLLLAHRYFGETAGYIESALVAIYIAFVSYKLLTTNNRAKWRKIIWITFSFIFFGQLALGLLGHSNFLQTGNLHYPVPVLMVSGPIYRLEGFFMVALFFTTVLLSGPAWCSQLCYVGAIDNWFSQRVRRRKTILGADFRHYILLLAVSIPIALQIFDLNPIIIHSLIIIFIFITITSFYISNKQGISFYCSRVCPISLLSTSIGKVNPLRLKIDNKCDQCGACINTCKYSAIHQHDGKVEINSRCTICMDCTTSCHCESIRLSVFNSKISVRDEVFYAIVLTLHGVFIACARI